MKNEIMTSKEFVKKSIHFEGPQRIPHYLPDGRENDLFWCAPWKVKEDKVIPDILEWTNKGDIDQRIDCWGTTWERTTGKITNAGQAKKYPITDMTRQTEYKFPDFNNFKYWTKRKEAIEKNNTMNNPKYVLGVLSFGSMNEGIHNIRGLQNMFMDYYEFPDDLKSLIARFAEKQRESIRMLADFGADGVMAYDDWGLQDSLMVSKDLIEEFFMPHYRKNWKLAHDLGMDVWMHSCGYIIEILPMFAQAGLNVAQCDQQQNMGLENLSEKVGGKIAFWCPADMQKVMVDGSPEDVRQYVKKMIKTLGSHNGGLVSMAYESPEAVSHNLENTKAMCEAFREFERY